MKPLFTKYKSTEDIKEFRGDYKFLSNFYRSSVEYNHIIYPTSEHLYQALKSIDKDLRLKISLLKTPEEAKKFGQTLELRYAWDLMKISVMEMCLSLKFDQNPKLKNLLIETNPRILIDGNYWHDNFWGNCFCEQCSNITGENQLGLLLMKLRTRYYGKI